MVLVNSGFPQAKDFLRNLPAIWTRALKNFLQPYSRPKKLKKKKLSVLSGVHISRADPEGNPKCILK
jgi:hypothetical protein